MIAQITRFSSSAESLCAYFLGNMVGMPPIRERIRFQNYSTSHCGYRRKILSEQTCGVADQ